MNTSSVYIHSLSALTRYRLSSALREGSSVLINVLSKESDSKYTVSFLGSKFSVTSENPLKVGIAFNATVAFKEGKIVLVADEISTSKNLLNLKLPVALESFKNENFFAPFLPLENAELASYFSSLGLPQDNLTFKLFQQMQQLGAKLDVSRLLKARLLAVKFPGKEVLISELALILQEKGISLDCVDLAISSLLDESFAFKNKKNKKQKKDETLSSSIKDFVSKLFDLNSNFYQSDKLGKKAGLLTLFNQLKNIQESSYVHWVSIPFEIVRSNNIFASEIKKDEEVFNGRGTMRFCLDTNKNRTKKIVLSFNNLRQNYFFVVYFKSKTKSCNRVKFSISPVPNCGIEGAKKLVASFFEENSLELIEWIDEEQITPFDTEDLPISFVKGFV